MAKRPQLHRHVSKAGWSKAELRYIRAALEQHHGHGSRAQSLVCDGLKSYKRMSTEQRQAWRRRHPTLARH